RGNLNTTAVTFTPDGKFLIVGNGVNEWDAKQKNYQQWGDVTLWDVGARAKVRTLARLPAHVAWVAPSPDGKLLAGAGEGGQVSLWDLASGEVRGAFRVGHGGRLREGCGAFSPDSTLLAVGADGELQVWDCRKSRSAWTQAGVFKFVEAVAFSPDGG